jgi:hypothetical protein
MREWNLGRRAAVALVLAALLPSAAARDEWGWFRSSVEEPRPNWQDPAQAAAYSHFDWATALVRVINAAPVCGYRSMAWRSQIAGDLDTLQILRLRRWERQTTEPKRWKTYLESLFEWQRDSARNVSMEDCAHLDDDAIALADASEASMQRELRDFWTGRLK